MKKLLIIEDDKSFAGLVASFLGKNGFETQTAFSAKEGNACRRKEKYDLIILDYRLPDAIGLDILTEWRNEGDQTPVIIMTGFNDVSTAVRAIRCGAFDYVTKPVNHEELLVSVNTALQDRKSPQSGGFDPDRFVKGRSSASVKLHEQIALVAPTELSVIIMGESGTGKEFVANSIHKLSRRSEFPFVAVDCGTLSAELAKSELFGHVKGSFTGATADKKGKFEEAGGGTIFLDEIGNLGYEVQAMLLRALQERKISAVGSTGDVKVDIRVIAATNDDLREAVQQGKFREDLYHRLNEFSFRVPAVRQRKEDIMEFVRFFISESNAMMNRQVKGLSPEVENLFMHYPWPGNIREMRNMVRRAVLLTTGETIQPEALPAEMTETNTGTPVMDESITDLKWRKEISERELIERALKEAKYNKSKAAKQLNIDRSTLYAKLIKYGIDH